MRTTLNVDDDILETARELAHFREIPVGEALSMLARRGLATRMGTRRDPVSGLLVFDVPDDVPALTPEVIDRAEEREDLRYAKYFRKP